MNAEMILRMNLLGGMNEYLLEHCDGYERYIGTWLELGVPDEADEDELREIAEDIDEFNRITRLFGRLIGEFENDTMKELE